MLRLSIEPSACLIPMPKPPQQRSRRTAFVSLAFAVLPALILGFVGVSYLRHEKAIAEKELNNSAQSFAAKITKRLRDGYSEYLDSTEVRNRMVSLKSLRQFEMTTDPPTEADLEAWQSYQNFVLSGTADSMNTLRTQLPSFRNARTPAGLPLYPIAQLQLARFAMQSGDTKTGIGTIRALLESTVISQPSPVSELILARVSDLAEAADCREEVEFDKWVSIFSAKTETRKILQRNRDYLDRFGSEYPWFEDESRRFFPAMQAGGMVVVLSKTELEELAGSALSDILPIGRSYRYPLAFRLQLAGESITPSPLNQPGVRQNWFAENGIDPISHNQSGPDLILTEMGTPFTLRITSADYKGFQNSMRKRTVQQGSFLAFVMACLGFGVWKTWRTLEMQRTLTERQSNLISSISHELRSPVSGIRLLAEKLAGTKSKDDDREKYSLLIAKESGRLSALIENILDAGQIADGRKIYQFEWTNLSELARDTVERVRPLAESESRRITYQPDDAKVEISAEVDPVAVQQALTNLIDNALKFSGPGKGITVTLESLSDSDSVRLAVADEGIGIEEADQSKIFDLFYRAGTELQRETTGTGLGLHLVQHIVQSHGGTITVQSKPGEGSTFEIIIPRKRSSTE